VEASTAGRVISRYAKWAQREHCEARRIATALLLALVFVFLGLPAFLLLRSTLVIVRSPAKKRGRSAVYRT
jgi:hypothetical protein